MDDLLEQIKPIIYVPREFPGWELTEVLYEKFDDYYVLWFHWPHDGIMSTDGLGLHHEDYEPVVLVHKNSRLFSIGLRPGHQYISSINWSVDEKRSVIIFVTPWHHPEVDNNTSLQKVLKRSSVRNDTYIPIKGIPSESWFISADSGMTVYDYAQSIVRI